MITSTLTRIACGGINQTLLRTPATFAVPNRGGKSPGQSQGRRGRKDKYFGLLVPLGTFIHERDIFFRQKGLRCHPGLNAGFDYRNNSLFALADGYVTISTEKFQPNYDHPVVSKYYPEQVPTRMVRYLHVIPKKQEQKFKLVDLV